MTVLCLNLKEEVIASGKKEEEQKWYMCWNKIGADFPLRRKGQSLPFFSVVGKVLSLSKTHYTKIFWFPLQYKIRATVSKESWAHLLHQYFCCLSFYILRQVSACMVLILLILTLLLRSCFI
jgi:hypothetical protein